MEVKAEELRVRTGVRSLVLNAYAIGQTFMEHRGTIISIPSAAPHLSKLGVCVWYSDEQNHTGRRKRTAMDVEKMVEKWKKAVVGLAMAHDKDEADRAEAGIEECLSPILSAPIKQVREFAPRLLEALKADPRVPFVVWRAYEIWIVQLKNAPDEEIKELKTGLAREVAQLVEEDVRPQLVDAMVHALQWRSPEALEKLRTAVQAEHAQGKPVRLKGRESCLFLETGGTEEEPEFCIQL